MNDDSIEIKCELSLCDLQSAEYLELTAYRNDIAVGKLDAFRCYQIDFEPQHIDEDVFDAMDAESADLYDVGLFFREHGANIVEYYDGFVVIQKLEVFPPFRGIGVGKRLLDAVDDYDRGIPLLKVINAFPFESSKARFSQNQQKLIQYYNKFGYALVKDGFMVK